MKITNVIIIFTQNFQVLEKNIPLFVQGNRSVRVMDSNDNTIQSFYIALNGRYEIFLQ